MFPKALISQAEKLLHACEKQKVMLSFAESCTGGLITALMTEIAGSSAVVERGFVTYSNDAKHELLGVPLALIKRHGAVSGEVAQAMAEGALEHSRAQMSVAVTGIAGPTGGSKEKPVGLVYIAVAIRGKNTRTLIQQFHFKGKRSAVRISALTAALAMLRARLAHFA